MVRRVPSKSPEAALKENALYTTSKEALETVFRSLGQCEIEVTATKITEKAKTWLDDAALYFLRVEKQLPDLLGHFSPDAPKQLPYGLYEGVIVAEVKKQQLTVRHLCQTKIYAEVFDAVRAFLISPSKMTEEVRRFLSKRSLMLSYGAYHKVYIARLNADPATPRDNRLIDWYPENPFKP